MSSSTADDSSDHPTGNPVHAKPADLAYDEGTKNSHQTTDSKDQRTIANRLAAAEKQSKEQPSENKESQDPREAALKHGNQPSRGAEVDAQLMEEDAEIIKKMERKKEH